MAQTNLKKRLNMNNQFIFTITAGRTGTAWLANFFQDNLKIPTIHEPLEIDDFGNQMPDIRVMRSFNNRGMDEVCRSFWQRKFEKISGYNNYCETNHTLAKCGLVEALSTMNLDKKISFICLKRNWADQCASYINRSDFRNITITWQWYLHPNYTRKIVAPEPFLNSSPFGLMLWYIAEIEARQAYYKTLFGDKFDFIECNLESITTEEKAPWLLSRLGCSNPSPVFPEKKNTNVITSNNELKNNIKTVVEKISFNADQIAKAFIQSGGSLA